MLGSTTVSLVGDAAQGVDEDGDVEHLFLEQIAHSAGVLLEQPQRVSRLDILGQHENPDVSGARLGSSRAATSPSSVWVGGIRMSTTTTSGDSSSTARMTDW